MPTGTTVLPAQTRGDVTGSVVEPRLSLYQSQRTRLVQFVGCANLRVGLDFDALAGNAPPNTSRVAAHVDADLMRELMRSQKRDWDVGYGSRSSPLDNKLDQLDELVCFRVQFFGSAVRGQPPEVRSVPVLRFTPSAGGGSAFLVRPLRRAHAYEHHPVSAAVPPRPRWLH
jgi:hypothetical protein